MAWTDEDKAAVIEKYVAANPTPETSTEIVQQLSEEFEQSVNGVRMLLVREGVYVKKTPDTAKATSSAAGGGSKRVSKADSIAALVSAIEAAGQNVDEEIIGKLTGKAAIYFTEVITNAKG